MNPTLCHSPDAPHGGPAPATYALLPHHDYSSPLSVSNHRTLPIAETRVYPQVRETLAELLPPLRRAYGKEWFARLARMFGLTVRPSANGANMALVALRMIHSGIQGNGRDV